MKLYGKHYLVQLQGDFPRGKQCEHKTEGRWVVEHGKNLYVFWPSTQLQKDIWLGVMKDNKQDGTKLLKWFCNECGTIQRP